MVVGNEMMIQAASIRDAELPPSWHRLGPHTQLQRPCHQHPLGLRSNHRQRLRRCRLWARSQFPTG